jgi:tetratricopeptide (TPR) repeat protein
MAAETDPAKKSKEELDFAQLLFDANAYAQAKAEYEKILAESPDNPDALANMGLIYFNAGAAKETEGKKDEAKPLYQQAANYLQRFIDKAPEGHKFKADAKAVLDEMKNQQNVQAEKTTTRPKSGKRP